MADNQITIPIAQRRGTSGKPVSASTILAVVRAKLANPLASRELLAEQLGLHRATISEAVSTPFAQEQLAVLGDMSMAVHQKVEATIGDSLVFSHDAVRRGVNELTKEQPNPSAMTAAREISSQMLRATILPDKMRITAELKTAEDYPDEPLDPVIEKFLAAVGEGSSESED